MTENMNLNLTLERGRLGSLDLLRGVALLGILLVNIEAWSLPAALRSNPMALESSASDLFVWHFIRVFAEFKFVGLFSLLFGAGIAIQVERTKSMKIDIRPIYIRRMLWLGLFGILHAIIFWSHEILFTYAVWGLLVYHIATKSEAMQKRIMWYFLSMVMAALSIMAVLCQVFVEDSIHEFWLVSPEKLKETLEFILSDLSEQWGERAHRFILASTVGFVLSDFSWKVGAMMLLGMQLYRTGVLSAKRSFGWYYCIVKYGLIIGVGISAFGLLAGHYYQWAFFPAASIQMIWLQLSSFPLIFAYMAIVMIWYKKGWLLSFQRKIQSVGRMALTNYLMHTFIGTYLFYGYGLGLFNQLDRIELLTMTLGIWVVQIVISDIWLRYFKFGPFEWLWRSLTYGKWDDIRIRTLASS